MTAMNPRRVLFLVLCLMLAVPALAQEDAEEAPDSPLVQRAKEHIKTFNARRSGEENEAWRIRVLALADSLDTEGEYAMVAHCYERAGILDYYAGDLDAALETWDKGLTAARKSGEPKRIAALLNAKANGISAKGDNEAALAAHFETLALRQEMGDARGEGSTWHNIAYSQLALYQYPEAVESLRHAIRLHREAGNRHGLAVSYLSLAPRLESYVRFDEARAIADSAVATSFEVDQPQYIGTSLNARGDMHHRHGRDVEALADFDEAIAVLTQAGVDKFIGPAVSNRADVLASMDRFDEAAAESDRALPLLIENGDPAHPLICRTARGRIHLRAGEFEDANRVLQEVITDFRAFGDSLDDPVARAQASEAAGARSYLSFVHSRQGDVETAWQVVESGLAGVLRSEIGLDSSHVSLAGFQEKLDALNAVALYYGLATVEGLPAFLVTAEGIETWEIDVRHGIREAHADVLEMMAAGREGARLDEKLALLGEALLPNTLPQGVERIVIVPGSFASLPFETLIHHESELGAQYALSYAPSASMFVELEDRTVSDSGFLALADPVPGPVDPTDRWAERLRGESSAPLPEARAEVESIAPDEGITLMGAEATAAAFRAEAPGTAVIHLATHALVDPANPGDSALVLAAQSDGPPVLLARDIEGLSLDADLVCLSSCGTAGGYLVPGEGAFGLTRAFLVAGARTVVASWWAVEDAAGRRFMELFYQGLGEGLDRDVAARLARAAMADEGFGRRDRLAFAVVGAISGPLDETLKAGGGKSGNWVPYVGVGVVLLFALRRRFRS